MFIDFSPSYVLVMSRVMSLNFDFFVVENSDSTDVVAQFP